MSAENGTSREWSLACPKLVDAYTDFKLAKVAARVAKTTMKTYDYTAGFFVKWLGEIQGITEPSQIMARHVRAFLAMQIDRGLSDWSVNGFARSIRTLLRFWYAENYLPVEIKFEMPRIAAKRLPSLDADQIKSVLKTCDRRERAVLLIFVDSGLRRAELCALNWGDVDMSSGLVVVQRGKGGKARSVVIGAVTRRALLAYKKTLTSVKDVDPLIQTIDGRRFAGAGLYRLIERISENSGVKFSSHALRRSFALLSLRNGMSPLHIQGLMGHSTLTMTARYVQQLLDVDLLSAHNEHSVIDNLR